MRCVPLNLFKSYQENGEQFVTNTDILYSSEFLKDSTKINFDLKNIAMWLKANKILLNANKTEIVLFGSKKQKKH